MIRLREVDGGIVLKVHAVPRASMTRVVGEHDGSLKIAVAAVPDRGKANQALARFLSEVLEVRQQAVRLVAGEKNRRKEFRIEGVTRVQVAERLEALGIACTSS